MQAGRAGVEQIVSEVIGCPNAENRSGFRNYRTFSSAFKRKTEQTVTVWMKNEGLGLS